MALALAIFVEWQIAVLMEYFDAIFDRIRTLVG
jgi:flagellar biosynthesis protein FliQ